MFLRSTFTIDLSNSVILYISCQAFDTLILPKPQAYISPKNSNSHTILFSVHCSTSSHVYPSVPLMHKPSQLGNEVCLWRDLIKFVIGRVCSCFIVTDGHFVSMRLQRDNLNISSEISLCISNN